MRIGISDRWCVLAAAVAFAEPLHAQFIRPGATVEVVTPTLTIRSTVLATTPSILILGNARRTDSIPLPDIISWRSRTTHARAGATSGALAGGVAFTLFGAAAGPAFCEGSSCDGASLRGAGIGALFGIVAGGAFGAVLGSVIPKWTDHPKGTTPIVKESPLATLPISLYVSQGRVLGAGVVTAGGVQFAKHDWRLGVEGGRPEQGHTTNTVFQSATDYRLRSVTETSQSSSWLGVAAERRVAGIVWLAASATNRRRHETTTTDDLGSADKPRYPQFTHASTTAIHSDFGGSVGVVMRHRVFDDLYFRLDARQEVGPRSNRTLSVGIEL